MKKILFISHDASRTGAPVLLMNFINWLNVNNTDFNISLLLVEGGPLQKDFHKNIKTYNFMPTLKIDNAFFNKKHKRIYKKYLRFFVFNKKWDLIFSNTVANGPILTLFKKKAPIVSYIHELEDSINLFIDRKRAKETLALSDLFLCGSEMVKNTLVEKFNILNHKTKVVRSFIDFSKYSFEKEVDLNFKIRDDLMIASDTLVVGMIGSFIRRKGPDLFIETASRLTKHNIHFVWIGADNETYKNDLLDKYNTKNLKLSLLPSTIDYYKYYNCIDVLFLSSREDPYPMVMVEASAFGIPIICFENAGGTQEFIDERIGFVAPYEDTKFVANTIKKINKSLKSNNKDYIKRKSFKYHNINNNGQQIVDELKNVISKKR